MIVCVAKVEEGGEGGGAGSRWRNAWVQARSQRNGRIFHLLPPMSWGRNLAMAALGERLLDVPRLYGGPPAA